MKKIILTSLISLIVLLSFQSIAQIDTEYQKPSKEILDLINSPLTPSVSIDNNGEWMLLYERTPFKSIEEVSAKEYRLAGLRINPLNNGGSRTSYNTNITLKNIKSGEEFQVNGLPTNPKISNTSWSPDYSKVAFANTRKNGIELWILDIQTKEAKKLTEGVLNAVFRGNPFSWTQDGQSLICRFVNPDRGEMPNTNETPTGPIIQENLGKTAPSRTYQDLLQNKTDEALFDYFASSILVKVDLEGNITPMAGANIYNRVSQSPNGEYILATTITKPYSYLVPYYRYPTVLSLLDKDGTFIKVVQEIPLIEEMPKGFDAVEKGARNVSWRADKPASIYWVEALDGGDPKTEVEHRDAIYTTDYPFDLNDKHHLISVKNRYAGIQWGNDEIAIVYDDWYKNRQSNTYKINPNKDNENPEILFELNTEDLYNDPGNFVTEENEYGWNVLQITDNKYLYLTGEGYSPEGNKPFLRQYDIAKKTTKELWRADGVSTYETPGSRGLYYLNIKSGDMITNAQSKTDNPQYYLRNFKKKKAPKQLTFFVNPYKGLEGVSKEAIHYKRDDGVDLAATMYLPAGYDKVKDGRLPLLMWAYPREYKNPKTAGQVRNSPHRFTRIGYGSPIFWVLKGFVILENAEFPIIGVGETEPNDLFIPQLVANAKAAIDALDEMGIVDRERVAVGGHSYGAFMTANLLTHSDLFAGGIARSGAYNRTLTPFGFQSEERTYWEAPDLYFKMSPFMNADKMKHPLLLIHGVADNNSGTFPLQSERYYNALKGHGATVRLVMLPAESHGYASSESILHVLWETDRWLMKYVKNKK